MELSADKIINPQNHKLNKWLLFKKKDYFVGMKLEARIQHSVGFIDDNKQSHTVKCYLASLSYNVLGKMSLST